MTRIVLALVVAVLALWSVPAASKTVVEFSRPARTCDEFADRPFDGTTKIVYAYGDADPLHDKPDIDLNKAASFGQTSINLAASPWPDPPEDDTTIVELATADFAVPSEEMFDYHDSSTNVLVASGWDLYRAIPEADDAHRVHMTKFEIIRGHDEYVHHIDVHPCRSLDDSALDQSGWSTPHGRNLDASLETCWGDKLEVEEYNQGRTPRRDGPVMPSASLSQFLVPPVLCPKRGAMPKTPSSLSNPITMPPDAGVLIGGPDRTTGWRFVLMEIHYDVSFYERPPGAGDDWRPEQMFLDNSGVRMWVTSTLRPYDMGSAWIGVNVDDIEWPASQPRFTLRAPSSKKCARQGRPLGPNGEPSDLHVAQAFFKLAHQKQGSIIARHYRDGRELAPLAVDNNFNALYAQTLSVDAEWRHDDVIVIECEFDSAAKAQPHANICAVKLHYYPALTELPLPLFSEDLRGEADHTYRNMYCNDTYQFDPLDYEPWTEPESCPRGLKHSHPKFGDSAARPLHEFDSAAYDVHTFLDLEEKYAVHWRYDVDSDIVDFALEVDTDGWVAFGVSSSQGEYSGDWDEFHSLVPVAPEMPADRYVSDDEIRRGLPQSDVIVSWVDDDTGTPHFYDNYVDDTLKTHVDELQDYFRVKAMQDGVAYDRSAERR